MIRSLVMCLLVLSVAGVSADEKPLKVLMIGNSFSMSVDVTTCAYKPKDMSDDLARTLRDCAAAAIKEGVGLR